MLNNDGISLVKIYILNESLAEFENTFVVGIVVCHTKAIDIF